MQIYTIYLATNKVNQKRYVGFDSCWPNRKRDHKRDALKVKTQKVFHKAIRKHGWDSFEWNVIYQSLDKDHTLSQMERHFITEYNTYTGFANCNGYNLTLGGEGKPGYKPSEETRKKMLATKGGKPAYKHSEETRKKMSTTRKGKMGEETRKKLSTALKGKPAKLSRQISTPHGIFDSVAKCSEQIGLSKYIILQRVVSHNFSNWFYTGVEMSTRFVQQISTPHGIFTSICEASRQLNVNKSTIRARLQSKRNVGWSITNGNNFHYEIQ